MAYRPGRRVAALGRERLKNASAPRTPASRPRQAAMASWCVFQISSPFWLAWVEAGMRPDAHDGEALVGEDAFWIHWSGLRPENRGRG